MDLEFRSPDTRDPTWPRLPSAVPRLGLDGTHRAADDVSAAYDADVCVGHIESNRLDLTAPGDVRLTTAAITEFAIAPSHQRRGVLTGLMNHALTHAHARGQVLATLSSPMTALYARFGFGLAAEACAIEVDACGARPVHRPADGTIEVMATSDAFDTVTDVYDRCARSRVGTISREHTTWEHRLAAVPGGHEATRSNVAVHRDSTGLANGYVHYDITAGTDATPVGAIRDLWGDSPEIERALWGHLLTIDDVPTWRAPRRPVDDPVRLALGDVRAYRIVRQFDEQWLRVLDVDIALGTRVYNSCTRAATIKVVDPVITANAGTWRIDAHGSFRSQGDPDIELTIDMLSAVYLGGVSFRSLHDAGRIVERRSGAVADADILFSSWPRPFCGTDA